MAKNRKETVEIPVEWHVGEEVMTKFATNITIQRNEHETIISFYEASPPLLFGTPAQKAVKAARAGFFSALESRKQFRATV